MSDRVDADGALYPEAFAQYAPPIIEKPENVIHGWEFFGRVASRMQRPLTLKYWNYGQGFDAIKGALLLDVNNKPDPEEMMRLICKKIAVCLLMNC